MPRHASRILAAIFTLSLAHLAAADNNARSPLPTLFLIGDSTVNNSGHGLQGWGTPIAYFFDTNKIRVENHAIGGRSSRSFLTEGRWDKVLTELKPGDFLVYRMIFNQEDATGKFGFAPGRSANWKSCRVRCGSTLLTGKFEKGLG